MNIAFGEWQAWLNTLQGWCRPAIRMVLPLSALLYTQFAHADDYVPQFDRPSISYAPSVLPARSFDWEQGLPDFQHFNIDGVRSTTYNADTELRFGLGSSLELQVAGTPWNELDVHSAGFSSSVEGAGDTSLALKWAPTMPIKSLSFAMLGKVTFDTGSAAFSNGRAIYSLAAATSSDLGGSRSLGFYANVDHSGSVNTWTLSPNFNFPISGNLSGMVEAGRIFGGGVPSSTVVGGALSWLLRNRVQFDVFARRGLTSSSPDYQGGFGISVFWQ
ncbi:MAG TPA: transporter [Xanthomonadaceae bacterium]|nr:transporter [Xanthomonadaceae bacterium]